MSSVFVYITQSMKVRQLGCGTALLTAFLLWFLIDLLLEMVPVLVISDAFFMG